MKVGRLEKWKVRLHLCRVWTLSCWGFCFSFIIIFNRQTVIILPFIFFFLTNILSSFSLTWTKVSWSCRNPPRRREHHQPVPTAYRVSWLLSWCCLFKRCNVRLYLKSWKGREHPDKTADRHSFVLFKHSLTITWLWCCNSPLFQCLQRDELLNFTSHMFEPSWSPKGLQMRQDTLLLCNALLCGFTWQSRACGLLNSPWQMGQAFPASLHWLLVAGVPVPWDRRKRAFSAGGRLSNPGLTNKMVSTHLTR